MSCAEDKAINNRNKIGVAAAAIMSLLPASLCGGQALKAAAVHRTAQQWAAYYSAQGIISTATYWRLSRIVDRNYRTRIISDADLKWELSLLHSKPIVDSPSSENALHQVVFLFLSALPPLTLPQKNQFFKAFVPYASDKNPQTREMAAVAFNEIPDVHTLPYLQEMQSDPNPQVRREAAWSIKTLQEQHTQHHASPLR